jgi:phage terminase large subunit-like protein
VELCVHKWSYAKSILDGDKIDITFLPILYGVPDDAECICGKCEGDKAGWRCPDWPGAGTTFPVKDLHDSYQEVLNTPSEEAAFRTLRTGQWVGSTNQFIPSNLWANCAANFNEEDLYGCEAVAGVDFARRHDLASTVIIVKKDDLYYFIPHFFIPEKFAQKKIKRDRVPYDVWHRQGMVTYTGGDSIDPEAIRDQLLSDDENFKFSEVRFDPTFFEETRQILEAAGLYMVEVPPTKDHMAEPTAFFERLVLDKKIRHPNNLCMNWCVENCCVKPDAEDRIMLDKKRITGRIDGATAAIIALGYFYASDAPFVMPRLL